MTTIVKVCEIFWHEYKSLIKHEKMGKIGTLIHKTFWRAYYFNLMTLTVTLDGNQIKQKKHGHKKFKTSIMHQMF